MRVEVVSRWGRITSYFTLALSCALTDSGVGTPVGIDWQAVDANKLSTRIHSTERWFYLRARQVGQGNECTEADSIVRNAFVIFSGPCRPAWSWRKTQRGCNPPPKAVAPAAGKKENGFGDERNSVARDIGLGCFACRAGRSHHPPECSTHHDRHERRLSDALHLICSRQQSRNGSGEAASVTFREWIIKTKLQSKGGARRVNGSHPP